MQQGTAGLKEVCPGERTMLEVQDLLLRNYSLHSTLWKTVGVMHRLYVITSDTPALLFVTAVIYATVLFH